MIQCDGFVFAAPPRTGSTWMLHALTEVGLTTGLTTGQKADLHKPFPDDCANFKVSLVRHPYAWLASYFLALNGGHVGVPEIDEIFGPMAKQSNNMTDMVYAYLAMNTPNLIGNAFSTYKADTIMRLEDFPWAPIEFFETVGVKDKALRPLRLLGWINAEKTSRIHTPKRDLIQAVVNNEPDFCDRYDYV